VRIRRIILSSRTEPDRINEPKLMPHIDLLRTRAQLLPELERHVSAGTETADNGAPTTLSVTDVVVAGLDEPALVGEDHHLGTVA